MQSENTSSIEGNSLIEKMSMRKNSALNYLVRAIHLIHQFHLISFTQVIERWRFALKRTLSKMSIVSIEFVIDSSSIHNIYGLSLGQ